MKHQIMTRVKGQGLRVKRKENKKTSPFPLHASPFEGGFSIPELIAIMSISVLLIGFATLNLVRAQNSTTLVSTTNALLADIKTQQIKAMQSDTEGRLVSDSYGIHFSSTQYILFHGSSYNSNDSANLSITIDTGIQFANNTFPSGNIIFTQGSGEIASYSASTNSIVLRAVSNSSQTETITLNKYGVVTSVQ